MSSPQARRVQRDLRVGDQQAGLRLDQTLAGLMPEFSRSRVQRWIEAGLVLVDGAPGRPKDRVRGGEVLRLDAVLEPDLIDAPQPIPIQVVFEDDQLAVIHKPAGLVLTHAQVALDSSGLRRAHRHESAPGRGPSGIIWRF
jgi:23S rRNA pseudouridine1911/1915/1917 synthase